MTSRLHNSKHAARAGRSSPPSPLALAHASCRAHICFVLACVLCRLLLRCLSTVWIECHCLTTPTSVRSLACKASTVHPVLSAPFQSLIDERTVISRSCSILFALSEPGTEHHIRESASAALSAGARNDNPVSQNTPSFHIMLEMSVSNPSMD